MIVTEAKAKTKWCPMVRPAQHNHNRKPDGNYVEPNCIASGCMLWRWTNVGTKDNGYCGLAK